MKSKLALTLMAAVGSSALVASAQPPQPSIPARNTFVPVEYQKTDYSPAQYVRTPQPSAPAAGPQPPAQPALAPIPSPPGPNFAYAQPLFHSGPGWGGRVTSAEEANLAREADQLARQLG